ncbi:MAG: GTP-binding protein, partial [Candidatus Thorarchaeota archaeon]|nr:GTP-binding protein [Candidatus Thorarchaeota archaeon]
GCGKSTIASRLSTGTFVDHKMTIGLGIDSWTSIDTEEGIEVHASIFDLGGQEHFRFFHEGLATGAHIILLVFDLNRFKSLFDLNEWIPIIEQIPRDRWILVGTKLDETRFVGDEDIQEKANDLNIPWVTVSAKTGANFEKLLHLITAIKTK